MIRVGSSLVKAIYFLPWKTRCAHDIPHINHSISIYWWYPLDELNIPQCAEHTLHWLIHLLVTMILNPLFVHMFVGLFVHMFVNISKYSPTWNSKKAKNDKIRTPKRFLKVWSCLKISRIKYCVKGLKYTRPNNRELKSDCVVERRWEATLSKLIKAMCRFWDRSELIKKMWRHVACMLIKFKEATRWFQVTGIPRWGGHRLAVIYSNIVPLNSKLFNKYLRRHPSKHIRTKKPPEKLSRCLQEP